MKKSFWKEVTCSEMLSRAAGLLALWEVDWGQEKTGRGVRDTAVLPGADHLISGGWGWGGAAGGVLSCPVAHTVAAAAWGGSHLPAPWA